MREFKHQITISVDLAEFLDFIEVYDSASSAGVAAFAISEALILRYLLDHVNDRNAWYVKIRDELNSIIKRLDTTSQDEDIPFIYPRNDSLPEYYLEHSEILPWLKMLHKAVTAVKGSNVLP